MIRGNSATWQGDESMAAIRAGQGLLVGLLRCGRCGRKLHVRYWGGTGANARYLCKGDYDDGGQYCIGFGGASVDRRLGQELVKVISPFGADASVRALEELSAGNIAQRATLSSKVEIETIKQRLSSLNEKRYSLSSEDAASHSGFRVSSASNSPPTLSISSISRTHGFSQRSARSCGPSWKNSSEWRSRPKDAHSEPRTLPNVFR